MDTSQVFDLTLAQSIINPLINELLVKIKFLQEDDVFSTRTHEKPLLHFAMSKITQSMGQLMLGGK